MGPIELVGGADEEIRTQGAHVEDEMRGVMNRVHQQQGAHGVGEFACEFDVVHGAEGVRRVADRNEPRAGADRGAQVRGIEPAVRVQPHLTHDDAGGTQARPRRAVRLVIELRDDDLVSRRPPPFERMAQRVIERRHVRAQRNAGGVLRTEKCAEYGARAPERGIDVGRSGEAPSAIRIVVAVGFRDRADHLPRNLGAARAVEIHQGMARLGAGEGRKVAAAIEAGS